MKYSELLVILVFFSVSDLARLSLQLPPSSQLTVAVAQLNKEAECTVWIRSALLLPLFADSAVL